ncbi:hypothetical protein PMAYCL1PPCAC_30344 [Pristionchus mayeri]|uniref:Major facilitator superfamily (MFS) profile domain-containing protein n=1 Tax=Pristionchus mayeri TaxID=1317129 RepID=A0AAN5ID26_9BILA|nr:hypothetical protein PMAYCL1PPCAC_30344 [Pristionchus mayeri]
MPPSLHSSVHLPLGLYSITSAMFMPTFKSLIYRKACFDVSNATHPLDCDSDNSSVSTHPGVQAWANEISMWCSAAMCIGAILSSMVLGRIGDRRSHRVALLVPLVGLIASDLLLLLQWTSYQSSTLLLILSEAVFGLCGGYVSILSSCFAYASVKHEGDEEGRSVSIARLEGSIGLGAVVGLLLCTQLGGFLTYKHFFLFFLVVHVIGLILVFFMADLRPSDTRRRQRESMWKESFQFLSKSGALKRPLMILLGAFFACFFAFIGSSHIILYYLKHRFSMSITTFSIYRASEKALSTATALFLFPYLRRRGGMDNVALALVGMTTRAMAKGWTAIAWSETTLYFTLIPEAFSRFAASALRSLMAAQVRPDEQGRLFSFVALLEALCNLLAVVFFHTLFPWSLPIMSALSFIVMAALLVPPILLIKCHHDAIESSSAVGNEEDSNEEKQMVTKEEGKA